MRVNLTPGPYTIRWRRDEADGWLTLTRKNSNRPRQFSSERAAEDYIFTSGDWRMNYQSTIERSAQ